MKIRILGISVVGLVLTCAAWADDLPQMGYMPKTSVKELAAIYGIVETPDTAGLIDPSDTAEAGLVRTGPTPTEGMPISAQSVQLGTSAK